MESIHEIGTLHPVREIAAFVHSASTTSLVRHEGAENPLDDYGKEFFGAHPSGVGYSGATGEPGLMQFGRCRNPGYDKGSLESVSVSAGYDSDDERMDRYVKSVMNTVKKGGKKVYCIDPATGAALDKTMPGYWAWPDAAKVSDGSGGRYLRPDTIKRMVAK